MSGDGTAGAAGGGFDVGKFVESFPVIAEAEGGLKRLRDLVLALACRGVLVSQDPLEGTSETLLEEMESKRKGKLSCTRVQPVAPEDEPYPIPGSWRWVRLGDLGGFLGGGTPSKSNEAFWKGSIPWVSPKDMKRPYIEDAEDHISDAAIEVSAVKMIPARSLLFVLRGMILAHSFPVAITTRKVTINQDMKALCFIVPDTGEYVLRACWAARARVLQRVERSSHGTCRLDADAVANLPIAFPPLAEQKRIVAKVDQMMKLCDALEAALRRKEQAAAKLAEAVVAELVA